ncbi:hypothetical protein Trydic_g3947 [Trypoxylus dichotomus]
MIFGCCNVYGISTKNNIDVAALSETKKKRNRNEFPDNYIHLYSAVNKDKRARAGIFIALHKRIPKRGMKLVSYKRKFSHNGSRGIWSQINTARATTDDVTADIKDNFFEDLTGILDTVGSKKDVMGDSNG